ncbi:MAG: hypothetical protein ACXABY_03005 [Candidatus Thorarchaeota archaeon]|jgi:hypothetical protein
MTDQEKTEEQEKKQEETRPEEQVADALKEFAGAPDPTQIEQWKQQYGEVFCSGFSPTELVVWRPIARKEFSDLQAEFAKAQTPVTQMDIEEKVVGLCSLWLSEPASQALARKAGSFTTLHEQILSNSNFMDPGVASALVIKL